MSANNSPFALKHMQSKGILPNLKRYSVGSIVKTFGLDALSSFMMLEVSVPCHFYS
jgi:hypothetical protein